MKRRTDYVTHFAALEICGDPSDAGNGLLLLPGKPGQPATIVAVGDDASPAVAFGAMSATGAVVPKFLPSTTAKTIADGAPTALFEVAVPAGEMVGGSFTFLIRAGDGTEVQAIAGLATYAAVAKGATVTGTVTYVAANEAKAVSSGTLTLAFTVLTAAGKATIRVQPTGSLTETIYTFEFTATPIRGAVTVL